MADNRFFCMYLPEDSNITPNYYKLYRTAMNADTFGRDVDLSTSIRQDISIASGLNTSTIVFDFMHQLPAGAHYTHIRIPIKGISLSQDNMYDIQIFTGTITPIDTSGDTDFTITSVYTESGLTYDHTTDYGAHYLEFDIDLTVPSTGVQYLGINYFRNSYTGSYSPEPMTFIAYSNYGDVGLTHKPAPHIVVSNATLYSVNDTITGIDAYYTNNYKTSAPYYVLQDSDYSLATWELITEAHIGGTTPLVNGTDFTWSATDTSITNNTFDNDSNTVNGIGTGKDIWITVTFGQTENIARFYTKTSASDLKMYFYYLDSNLGYYQYIGKSDYYAGSTLYAAVKTSSIKVRIVNESVYNRNVYDIRFYTMGGNMLDSNNKFYPSYSSSGTHIYVPEDGNTKYIYKAVAYDENNTELAGTQLMSNVTR